MEISETYSKQEEPANIHQLNSVKPSNPKGNDLLKGNIPLY